MENQNNEGRLVKKLLKEIRLLEEEVEAQAYINGLWIRFYTTMKKLVNKQYPDSALEEVVDSAVKESSSWEDIWGWIGEAKEAERQFFERVEDDLQDSSDLYRLKTEVDFLKGVVRALLSTREMRLESILTGYTDWNSEVGKEISDLLQQNGMACTSASEGNES